MRQEHNCKFLDTESSRKYSDVRKDEVNEEVKILHEEELRDIYRSPSADRTVKSME
jgi:hypothetical protein